MDKEKKGASAWPRVARALLMSGLLWMLGVALLAWKTASGDVAEETVYPVLCLWTVAVSLGGAITAGWIPGRPLALVSGGLFAASLGLGALMRWGTFGGHGVGLLLCALGGGFFAQILCGAGRKKPRRYTR